METGLFCPNCRAAVAHEQAACSSCRFSRPDTGWPVDEYVGRLIKNKYRITKKLGHGGFGVVVMARHEHSGHDLGNVVLKFLHPHQADISSVRRRFVKEAQTARSLTSPHVVKVFDFDFDERGMPFIVMEHLQGSLLADVIERGQLDARRSINLGTQIAQALHECHEAGIVHRDLKPTNIMLLEGRNEDFVKLFDFGIAYIIDSSVSLTLLGTPRYMSPEQIQQQEIDAGTDIFALGVILFQCLTGKPPIEASSQTEYLQLNLHQEPRPLRELADHLPEQLERLLASMMAKDRAHRPSSMAEVASRLSAIEADRSWLPAEQGATSGGRTKSLTTDEVSELSTTHQTRVPVFRSVTNAVRRRRRLSLVVALIWILAAGVGLFLSFQWGIPGDEALVTDRSDSGIASQAVSPDGTMLDADASVVRVVGLPDAESSQVSVDAAMDQGGRLTTGNRSVVKRRRKGASPTGKRATLRKRGARREKPTRPNDEFEKVPGL